MKAFSPILSGPLGGLLLPIVLWGMDRKPFCDGSALTAILHAVTVTNLCPRPMCQSTPPAVWRKMRDLEKAWRPRKFAVLMTERDKVRLS